MSWDLEIFDYYQENLQQYQMEINKLEEKIEYIENKNKNNTIECSICLDRQPNILYLPCRHITNCNICSRNLQTCPLCLQIIDNKMEIFYG